MAGIASTVAGGLASLAGDLPKAVLFVRKYDDELTSAVSWDEVQQAQEKAEAAVKQMKFKQEEDGPSIEAQKQSAFASSVNSFLMTGRAAQTAAGLASAQDRLNETSAANNGTDSFNTMRKIVGDQYVAMEVQYNPSTIYIETSQGEREVNDGGLDNMSNNNIRQFRSEAYTNLSFQLVFDAMNQMDAFGLDASMLSAGGALSLGMDLAKNLGGDSEGFSVRTQVEGLIATLFSPVTRKVMFCWAGMIFLGDMLQVNAKYTMFNKVGNPIRATVDVTIQQGREDVKEEKSTTWGAAFDKVFGKKGMDATVGAASMLDKVKNNSILNLSL